MKGFTLTEVLIAILLISIFTTLSFPAWHHLLAKNQIEITTQDLMQLIKTSRQYAIEHNKSVVIGPSGERSNVIVARSQDQIIAELNIDQKNIHLSWTSNLGKNDQLIFMPTGMTNGQQGHFSVVSTTHAQAAEIVVLMSGSAYVRSKNLSMAESK